jgi:hypothetical protein
MVMGYAPTLGSFVINHSQDERPLIRIAALGARMRGSGCGGVPEVHERNEEDSGGKCSNQQDVHDERPRIIRP